MEENSNRSAMLRRPMLLSFLYWIKLNFQWRALSQFQNDFTISDDPKCIDARVTYDYFNFRRHNTIINQGLILVGVICTWHFIPLAELFLMLVLFETLEVYFALQFGQLVDGLKRGSFDQERWARERVRLNVLVAFGCLLAFAILLYKLPGEHAHILVIIYLFLVTLTSTMSFFSTKLNIVLISLQIGLALAYYLTLLLSGKLGINPTDQIALLVPTVLSFVVSHLIVAGHSHFYWSSLEQEKSSVLAKKELEVINERLSQEKYVVDTIYASINDAIVVVGEDCIIDFANGAFGQILGLPQEEGVNLADHLPAEVLVTDSRKRPYELKNGRHIVVEGVPLRVSDKEQALFVVADVTEQVEADKIAQSSSKLKALGTLSGGIAHDFHNALAVIQANVDLIELSDDVQQIKTDYLKDIKLTVKNSTGLTRQILTFVRNAPMRLEVLPARKVLENAVHLNQNLIEPNHSLVTECETENLIICDQSLLQNAILNLVLNARDALPEGGEISLRAYADGKRGVTFTVEDRGIGMSQEDVSRAAEPFFTKKPFEKGTGMGLALVKQFVERSSGTFNIQSEIGKGTIIKFYLPSPRDGKQHEVPKETLEISENDVFEILIVEDNTLLAKSLKMQLEIRGHSVKVAHSLDEVRALESLKFDFVVCDLALASETGVDVYHYMKEQGAKAKFIFMSGNPSSDVSEYLKGVKRAAFLEKPIEIDVLLNRMSRAKRNYTKS